MSGIRRILVLGATSLVGRFAVPRLLDESYEVVAVSRAPGGASERLSWVQADLTDPKLLLPEASMALSLSPIWLLPAALPAVQRAGVQRLIAFSSTSRFTKITSKEAAERDVAGRLADGEAAVEAFCAAKSIAWTVFRPTLIYAEGQDRNVSRLAEVIRRTGVLPLVGRARGLRQPVHAADLAEACVQALGAAQTFGRAYDLPGGETLSYRLMAERVFEGLGRRPRILPVPPALWRLGLKAAGPWLPGANAAMGDRMSEDLVFDAGPARRDFGWAPRPFHPNFS